MKKYLIMLIAVLALLGMIKMPVFSAERELDVFSVSATTYPVTVVGLTTAQITGDARIHHIVITNSLANIPQTVTFYEESNSTTTVTSKFVLEISSVSATAILPVQIPFPIPASPWTINDLCVRKSSLLSDVQVSIFYR